MFPLQHLSKKLIGLVLLANIFSSACATSQIAMTTGDLLDQADSVVLATCNTVTLRTGEANLFGRAVYFEFDVEEVIKGDPALTNGKLVLRLGGLNEASAPFNEGERMILFLGQTNADSYPTLYGSEQAVLRVESLNTSFPHPALRGQAFIKGQVTGLDSSLDMRQDNKPMTLDSFLDAARERVSKEKGATP